MRKSAHLPGPGAYLTPAHFDKHSQAQIATKFYPGREKREQIKRYKQILDLCKDRKVKKNLRNSSYMNVVYATEMKIAKSPSKKLDAFSTKKAASAYKFAKDSRFVGHRTE